MLDDFLERMAATPFVDGATDCVLTPAAWVVANGWPDPAADLRGRYRTPLGRERLLKRLGGIERVVGERMSAAGLGMTAHPRRGDVGLVALHSQIFGAISLGERWAIQSKAGLYSASPNRVLKAWSVLHG
ncbi:DUF6950 family protein [Brevundimonas vesicularis]|uniref:DUF6950 family protein n=1 Tax=Brevundimonas vesicularis TaxID=41276 RepID=UPI0038514DB8